MARQTINIGTTANDGTGDPLRTAFDKINDNFVELYGGDDDANTILEHDTAPKLAANLDVNDFQITTDKTNGNVNIQPNGTGNVSISAIQIKGTSISSSDSTIINVNDGLVVDGTATVSGALTSSTSLTLATGATVTGIDNGSLGSSATLLATQGAIKTYVDAQVTAQDLDFACDDSTTLSIDLDSESLQFSGGTGITTAGTANTVTIAIDGTVATLAGSQTFTNKVLTNPTINAATMTGAIAINGITLNDNTIIANASNADLELDGSGSGKVSISGIKHPTSDGSAGQVLQTDGSGNLSFATISSGSSTGDITFNGSTMISPSNGDITLDPSGTGHILFKSDTTAIGDGSGSEAALLTTPNDVALHIGPNTSQTNLTATNGLTNNSDGYIRLNSNGLISVRAAGDGYIYLGGESVLFGRTGVGGTSAAGKISSLGRENFTITANNNINGWEPLILLTAPGSGSSASVKAQSKITMQAGDTGSGSIEMTTINIFMTRLPTSDPSVAGQLYNDSGTLKISAG